MNLMDTLMLWNPLNVLQLDPVKQMDQMQDRFYRFFEGALGGATMLDWRPLVDVTEAEKEFTVKAELPEVKKEDVKVSFVDGSLTISGERKQEKEESGATWRNLERRYGAFSRTLPLPPGTDPASGTAKLDGGILTIRLPKKAQEPASVRAIQVE